MFSKSSLPSRTKNDAPCYLSHRTGISFQWLDGYMRKSKTWLSWFRSKSSSNVTWLCEYAVVRNDDLGDDRLQVHVLSEMTLGLDVWEAEIACWRPVERFEMFSGWARNWSLWVLTSFGAKASTIESRMGSGRLKMRVVAKAYLSGISESVGNFPARTARAEGWRTVCSEVSLCRSVLAFHWISWRLQSSMIDRS